MATKFNLDKFRSDAKLRISELETGIDDARGRRDRLERQWMTEYRAHDPHESISYDLMKETEKLIHRLEKEHNNLTVLTAERGYASEYLYSDVNAYEIVGIPSAKSLLVRELDTELTPEAKTKLHASFIPGGFCGHFENDLQEWTYTSNPSNPVLTVLLHNDGNYYLAGSRTCPFRLHTEPYHHYDFNF